MSRSPTSDVDTATIRVRSRSRSRPAATAATPTSTSATECRLRVGDFTGQLLSDPEPGALTAWSQTVGTWSITPRRCNGRRSTSGPTTARRAAAPGDHASRRVERNATAELVGRTNDDTGDTGHRPCCRRSTAAARCSPARRRTPRPAPRLAAPTSGVAAPALDPRSGRHGDGARAARRGARDRHVAKPRALATPDLRCVQELTWSTRRTSRST